MKAAYYERQGPAREVLIVGELPDPEPGPGQVRVRIHFSGVNPSDIKGRSGFAGAPMRFPRIVPHQDGAGVIDRVGAGVPESRIGERVWLYEAQIGRPAGTAADYTVVPSINAVPMPDGVPFDVGACLGVAAMTAHRCLFADGKLDGTWVLVQGGAGAVGTAAILLANWAGAQVATTISRPEQEVVVRRAGADVIINRRTDNVPARVRDATGNAGVARIVDVDLAANVAADLACLAPNGTVSAYATDNPDALLSVPFLTTMLRGLVFRFVYVYLMPAEAHSDAIRDINACLAADAYQPEIALRLPLDRIAEAHEAQASGRAVGKILIEIAG
jgi:NADPH:quinone reductase-like Zn-dependent oxidoreductase